MKLVVTAVYGEEEVLFPTVVGDGRKTFKWLGEWSFAAASRGFGRPLTLTRHTFTQASASPNAFARKGLMVASEEGERKARTKHVP